MAYLTEEQKNQALHIFRNTDNSYDGFDYLIDIISHEQFYSNEEKTVFEEGFIKGFLIQNELIKYLLNDFRGGKGNE
ncbi:hypothetical protein [Metabacillus litoralis]|uniref:hypothetical protein n=1 Tax=Metabacillus litoralis TaxID=152268 RepID=UPI00203E40E6|nr:hypothetical protein [Metabacillus litoralis]MCM3165099.1 hypothetical protein [Metabacillus litoralis]